MQIIVNDLYKFNFSRGGDYVMQDITNIEDHQYQTITPDNKSNTLSLLSFLLLPSVSLFSLYLLTSDPKLFFHLIFSLTYSLFHIGYLNGRLSGTLTINIFNLYSYSYVF